MQWFYAVDNRQVGPVADEEFKALVRDGTVGPDTLVWHEGMDQWTPHRMVATGAPGFLRPKQPLRVATPASATCSQCGQSVPAAQIVQHDGVSLCPSCVSAENDPLAAIHYGGFWIRFVAKMIDGLILSALSTIIIVGCMLLHLVRISLDNPLAMLADLTRLNLLMFLLQIFYATFFVGKFGGTPGKLALGLLVVRADCSRVSYGRAFGRFFAEFLSGLILCIGYIMAAFDDEKRALHDRICDTRVVHKS